MKYGEHLKANIAPEYGPEPYLKYSLLDDIIRELSQRAPSSAVLESRQVSLTTPPQTNAQGLAQSNEVPTEEKFLKVLEEELLKVESFTLEKVTELRNKIDFVETMEVVTDDESETIHRTQEVEDVFVKTEEIAEDFLRLEKYVNINFMGFHKILKKHDKWLPNNPCKQFYVNRMHSQAWVRGDYSDLVVRLSHIYSTLRQDHNVLTKGNENDDNNDRSPMPSQNVTRTTTKYWVKTEDVSRVKYRVLRHLPLYLQKISSGESDSQFTNSVYLDNDQLELYHAALDKTPGAIELRLRWYGPSNPTMVVVERKTHHDKLTGESWIMERFDIDESEVHQVLTNTYPIEMKKEEMLKEGKKTQQQLEEWETLVREVTQIIASKQLVPTVRTQCMRTAFQIPFDSTVRISLDTNFCMISERGYDLQDMKVWHRDPSWEIQPNEITRFPHAALEIQMQFSADNHNITMPKWVADLQSSGLIYECHRFSKFVHGCSVLLPEDVCAVPYWIDDASLRESIVSSGASRILEQEPEVPDPATPINETRKTGATFEAGMKPIQEEGGTPAGNNSNRPVPTNDVYNDENEGNEGTLEDTCCSWMAPFCSRNNNADYDTVVSPPSIGKIEPKVFFANERTFLHWLHHGVILSTIASGILVYCETSGEKWAEYYAMMLLVISLGFCIYALHLFLWRADRIKTRTPGRWDDPLAPLLLGGVVAVALTASFIVKLYEIAKFIQQSN